MCQEKGLKMSSQLEQEVGLAYARIDLINNPTEQLYSTLKMNTQIPELE